METMKGLIFYGNTMESQCHHFRSASWESCSTYGQKYKCTCLNRKTKIFCPGILRTESSGWYNTSCHQVLKYGVAAIHSVTTCWHIMCLAYARREGSLPSWNMQSRHSAGIKQNDIRELVTLVIWAPKVKNKLLGKQRDLV